MIFLNYRGVLDGTGNRLDRLFAGFTGKRPKGEIDYRLNVRRECMWSKTDEEYENLNMTKFQSDVNFVFQYKVNHDYTYYLPYPYFL